jgi:hypothetical protein
MADKVSKARLLFTGQFLFLPQSFFFSPESCFRQHYKFAKIIKMMVFPFWKVSAVLIGRPRT